MLERHFDSQGSKGATLHNKFTKQESLPNFASRLETQAQEFYDPGP